MPVILATQKAEIMWISVVHDTLPQNKKIPKIMADGVAQGVGPEFNPQYC
jgi:hypothetical protein